jgi:hypothetical protein
MRHLLSLSFAALSFASLPAMAGEFGDHCAMGLAIGKKVKTDCSISQMGADGKTYCFGNEQAKWAFAGDFQDNVKKAADFYSKNK